MHYNCHARTQQKRTKLVSKSKTPPKVKPLVVKPNDIKKEPSHSWKKIKNK